MRTDNLRIFYQKNTKQFCCFPLPDIDDPVGLTLLPPNFQAPFQLVYFFLFSFLLICEPLAFQIILLMPQFKILIPFIHRFALIIHHRILIHHFTVHLRLIHYFPLHWFHLFLLHRFPIILDLQIRKHFWQPIFAQDFSLFSWLFFSSFIRLRDGLFFRPLLWWAYLI